MSAVVTKSLIKTHKKNEHKSVVRLRYCQFKHLYLSHWMHSAVQGISLVPEIGFITNTDLFTHMYSFVTFSHVKTIIHAYIILQHVFY